MAVHVGQSRSAEAPAVPRLRPAPEAGPRQRERRPALDGVRGLAIALVVLHHFTEGLAHRPEGGFLGVDLFFVLSGYLITGLLVRTRLRTGRIGLAGFWLRRARRLLPPLLVVLVALTWVLHWAGPPENRPYERYDALSTLFYTSNLHMLASFDPWGRNQHPGLLAHTWSLAIEEQFYVVWPLLLAGLLAVGARRGRLRVPALVLCVVAGAASFAWLAAAYFAGVAPAAYFDTRGRVGELLAGAALALVLPALRRRATARLGQGARRLWGAVATVALLGVLAAVGTLDYGLPAYYLGGAMAVTLAAVALLAAVEAAPDGTIARCLAWAPLAGLGKISYTLYLVHFPAVALIPLPDQPTPGGVIRIEIGRLCLAVGFATVSYLALERPLLAGTLPWLGRSRLRLALAAGAATAASVTVLVAGTSLPGNLDAQVLAEPVIACPGQTIHVLDTCQLSSGVDQWVVTGDGGAAGIARALSTVPGLGVVQAAWPSCGAAGLTAARGRRAARLVPVEPGTLCARDTPRLVAEAVARPETTVLLVADATSARIPLDAGEGRRLPSGSDAHDAVIRAALLRLVDTAAARGVHTVLLRQPPPSRGIGELVAPGTPGARSAPAEEVAQELARYDDVLAAVAAARTGWARVVTVDDLVCPGGRCPAVVDGLLVRHDAQAFAPAFARRIAPALAERVRAAVMPPRRAG